MGVNRPGQVEACKVGCRTAEWGDPFAGGSAAHVLERVGREAEPR